MADFSQIKSIHISKTGSQHVNSSGKVTMTLQVEGADEVRIVLFPAHCSFCSPVFHKHHKILRRGRNFLACSFDLYPMAYHPKVSGSGLFTSFSYSYW